MRPTRALLSMLGTVGVLVACGGDDTPVEPPNPWPDDPPGARRDTLEELRRFRDAPKHSSDGAGTVWLTNGPTEIAAGGFGEWTFVFEAGPEGVAVGGSVRLIVSPYWDWSPPQTAWPERPGLVTASTDADGLELDVTVPAWVDVRIAGRALAAGERVKVVYGAGEAKARADRYADRDARFWFAVDGDGDGVGVVLEASPAIDVLAGPPVRLVAHVPSVRRPGEGAAVRLAVLDAAGSSGVRFEGELTLASEPEGLELPPSITLAVGDGGLASVPFGATTPGVFRVVARGPDGLEAISNPLHVHAASPRVFWGDLHGHSGLSDGTGTPDDYYRYARDVAALDVAVLTDHDHFGVIPLVERDDWWDEIRASTELHHRPGRFVTILGYEWTSWLHGHRHVLYFDGEGEVLSSVDERYDDPDELWDALRGRDAMTFAHHSGGGPVPTNWDFAPDPLLETVVEVASVHGSSESLHTPGGIYSPAPGSFVRDALDRGYRLGMVGSGDSHDGHPGLAHLASAQGGVAAILADELTREGIAEALRERRCYATNGPRILLRAALDGKRMGEVLPAPGPDATSTLYVNAITTAPIDTIDIVRSGRVTQRLGVGEVDDVATTIELTGLTSGEYVYVRVVQTDGGAAWSSPFFVD